MIEGLSGPASQVRLTDLAGRDMTNELDPRPHARGLSVALRQAQQFVVKPRLVTTVALTQERVTLPGGIVVPLAAPADDESGTAPSAWFRLVCAASPVPAPWVATAPGYVTRLTFGLKRPPQLPDTVRPGVPVVVKIGFEGLTGPELPVLTLSDAGLEHEQSVDLRFVPRTPEPKLLVRSTLSDVDLALVALPRLELRPARRNFLGLGLESVDVVAESVWPYGAPRPFADATPLTIEIAGGGRLETDAAAFAAGSARTVFRVRSAGLGVLRLRASANGIEGDAELGARFPSGPLLAALAGGALGGFARRFVKGARRKRTGRSAVEGLIVGTIAFVAGVLGVGYLNLPQLIVATEAGAFLTAVLTGFIGVTVLGALAKSRTSERAD